jgi:ABC-type sugar transport system substrate-binding protein
MVKMSVTKQKLRGSLLLMLVFMFVLSACSTTGGSNTAPGGIQGNAPSNSSESNGTSGATAKKRIAFIPQLIGIPYFTAMEKGGKKAAADLNAEFLYTGATTASAQEQLKIMDSLIRQKVDAIAVSVLDSSSINPAIKRAKDAGIPVFTSDSDSPDSIRDVYVAQATDQDLGYTIIDRLAAQIGGKGEVGIISGESTATNLNTWIDFMKERAKANYPDMKIVDVRYTTGGSSEQALNSAQELMTRYPNIKGLVAVASSTVPGVAQAVKQAGKSGQIAVIGFGSPATVKPFIDDGVMKESVLWNAVDLGYLTVWAGLQLAEGKAFQETNVIPGVTAPVKYFADTKTLLLGPPLVINKDNVNDFDF